MQRRNPAFTAAMFQAFLVSKNMDRFAELVGKYPDVVDPYLDKIHARLVEKGLITTGASSTGGRGALTDREAWNALADLVPTALGDQPQAFQTALAQAFRNEAAAAR